LNNFVIQLIKGTKQGKPTFKPNGIGINYVKMEIYNRWGELIFRNEGADPYWSASDVPDGVYVYKLIIELEYKGVKRSEVSACKVHVLR
jgi:hypothetical protein